MQSSLYQFPPPGFHFLPTDEELINDYLLNKVHGCLPAEAATLIRDYNLYGEEEPWQIFDKFQGDKNRNNGLYFFTKLCKKTLNSTKNKNRKVGTNGGTWHGDAKDPIKARDGTVIGTKKSFRYKNKLNPDHERWIMMQYSSESISEDIVICQLKKKESNKRKSMDSSELTVEVAEDDSDTIQTIQSIISYPVMNSTPISWSQVQEPQQITVSMGNESGQYSTEGTFSNIQHMELGTSTIINSTPEMSQILEPQQITEYDQEMFWLGAGTHTVEVYGDFATADAFYNETAFVNSEPISWSQLQEPHQITVSMGNDSGRYSAEGTFSNIQNMELGASTIINSAHELSQIQEPHQFVEYDQEMFRLRTGTLMVEDYGVWPTADAFYNETAFVNSGPINWSQTLEPQQISEQSNNKCV